MARTFNGTSDLIDVNPFVYAGAVSPITFSVAAWIKTTMGGIGSIFGSDSGTNPNRFCQFRVSSGKLQLLLFGTAIRTWTSTSNVNTGAWVHVGGAYNGTVGVLYVNGGAEGTATLSATAHNPARARIGAQIPGVTQTLFNGTIAEVATFDRGLSARDFASLASGLPASHLDPSFYYPLWGVDSPEPDIGHAAHSSGVLTGTTAATGGKVSPNLLLTA